MHSIPNIELVFLLGEGTSYESRPVIHETGADFRSTAATPNESKGATTQLEHRLAKSS